MLTPDDVPGIKPNKFSGTERTPEYVAAELPPTVTMNFPQSVTLTLTPGDYVTYPAGTNEVPESLSTHWYLQACGATIQAN